MGEYNNCTRIFQGGMCFDIPNMRGGGGDFLLSNLKKKHPRSAIIIKKQSLAKSITHSL